MNCSCRHCDRIQQRNLKRLQMHKRAVFKKNKRKLKKVLTNVEPFDKIYLVDATKTLKSKIKKVKKSVDKQ